MSTALYIAIAGQLDPATATYRASQALHHLNKTAKRCPHCNGVIYSKRFSTCRDCGADLPNRSRFAPTQAAMLQAEVEASLARSRSLDSGLGRIQPIGTFAL